MDVDRQPTKAKRICQGLCHTGETGSVGSAEPLTGSSGIWRFFTATRGMYDRIAFIGETKADKTTYMEWTGQFHGKPVAGMTVLTFNEGGLIEAVRLYHRPYHQVIEFADELASRLS
jgi:hypothetical protein